MSGWTRNAQEPSRKTGANPEEAAMSMTKSQARAIGQARTLGMLSD